MEKNQKNTPVLRFPEFEGEWERKQLGEVATFTKGKGISKADISEDGITECIRYGELYTFYGETINDIKSKTNVNVKDLVLSEANDVIIPASGETQIDIATASCVLKAGIALGGDLNIIKSDNNGVFLSYYLNSAKKQDIAGLAQGIAVVHLYSSQLATLNLNLPTLPEQQKIAAFFTAIDKKLQGLKEKKSLLEAYKKGVMQQLFAQEIRFKNAEGGDFEDWEVRRLGEVYSFKVTNSFSRDNLNYEAGEVKNIHYGDIHTKFSTLFNITIEKVPFINPDINIDKIAEENYCIEGDIVFADASEDLNDVGKSIEIVKLNSEKVLAGLHTILARPTNFNLSKGFGGYLFKSENIRLQIQKEAQGSKVLSISAGRLSNIQIPLPSLPEQTLIADCLSALDAKIAGVSGQIGAMEAWKKGLLQNMFT